MSSVKAKLKKMTVFQNILLMHFTTRRLFIFQEMKTFEESVEGNFLFFEQFSFQKVESRRLSDHFDPFSKSEKLWLPLFRSHQNNDFARNHWKPASAFCTFGIRTTGRNALKNQNCTFKIQQNKNWKQYNQELDEFENSWKQQDLRGAVLDPPPTANPWYSGGGVLFLFHIVNKSFT